MTAVTPSSTGLTVETVAAVSLGAAERDAWAAIQDAQPAYHSPLLSPGFAMAVGRVREDARVSIFCRHDRIVGFWAHHRRPGGFGRAVGAPFADYHAIVATPDAFAGCENPVALAGLKAFRHGGLIDPYGLFPAPERSQDAFAIDLKDASPEAYLETLRAASPKKFKNYRRLQNRLRELGELSLRADADAATFDTLLRWKSEQFARTGAQDVLRPAWASALMHDLFGLRSGPTTGLMLTLHAGDRLVGGHFGIVQTFAGRGVYHPWIASMDPELNPYSPGYAYLDQAIRAMPGLGIDVYDLGVGHDHYKRPYALDVKTVVGGLQSAPGGTAALLRVREEAWRLGPLGRSGAVDKVRRRLDHIAVVDPSLRGRVHGLVEAARATRRRSLSGEDQG